MPGGHEDIHSFSAGARACRKRCKGQQEDEVVENMMATCWEVLTTRINRIIPRHIQLAIRNDEELNKLLGHVR